MNIFVTVLFLGAVFTSTKADSHGGIHGTYAGERQFPFLVGISRHREEDAAIHCSGSILSNYYILTAAHCLANLPEVTLHLGSVNSSAPVRTFTVDYRSFTIHEHYNASNKDNNIALIDTPYIFFTDNIKNVTLTSWPDASPAESEDVIGMGWSVDQFGGNNFHNLLYVNMTVMTNQDCWLKSLPATVFPWEPSTFNYTNTICVMTDHGSPCVADSGGPLLMASNNKLVGIFSFVINSVFCTPSAPVAYVRVSKYRNWLESKSGIYRFY